MDFVRSTSIEMNLWPMEFYFHFFSFKTSSSSPGKWNCHLLGFLPFIFSLGQCEFTPYFFTLCSQGHFAPWEHFASKWHGTLCIPTHFPSQHTLLPDSLYSSANVTPQHTLLLSTPCFLEHFLGPNPKTGFGLKVHSIK